MNASPSVQLMRFTARPKSIDVRFAKSHLAVMQQFLSWPDGAWPRPSFRRVGFSSTQPCATVPALTVQSVLPPLESRPTTHLDPQTSTLTSRQFVDRMLALR